MGGKRGRRKNNYGDDPVIWDCVVEEDDAEDILDDEWHINEKIAFNDDLMCKELNRLRRVYIELDYIYPSIIRNIVSEEFYRIVENNDCSGPDKNISVNQSDLPILY